LDASVKKELGWVAEFPPDMTDEGQQALEFEHLPLCRGWHSIMMRIVLGKGGSRVRRQRSF
jgi:hypothetical protein